RNPFRARSAEALGRKRDPPRFAEGELFYFCHFAPFRGEPAHAASDGGAPLPSHLLDLDQRAGEVFRVQEQDRLAMGADLRLAVAEHPRALGLELVAGGDDVSDLVAEMMHAAFGIALEEFCDRRIGAQRMQQFDLGVGEFDERHRHAVVGLGLRGGDMRAERLAIGPRGRFKIGDGDSDVVQFSDHIYPWLSGVRLTRAGKRGLTMTSQRRGSRPRIRSKPCLIAAKRASISGSNSTSVKMYGPSFSMPSRTR